MLTRYDADITIFGSVLNSMSTRTVSDRKFGRQSNNFLNEEESPNEKSFHGIQNFDN